MTTIKRSKLVMKDLGDPRAVLSKEAPSPMTLGTIIGIAEKTRTKNAQNGDTFEALIGNFEGKLHTPIEMTIDDHAVTVDTIQSNVCYLPAALHDPIETAMKADNNTPQHFGINVSVQRADNKAGFEYVVTSFLNPGRADPLSSIRSHTQTEEKQKAKAA